MYSDTSHQLINTANQISNMPQSAVLVYEYNREPASSKKWLQHLWLQRIFREE